jgi:hypothetical protein
MYTKIKAENLKGRGHLGDLDVYGRIILKRILNEIGCAVVDRIQLAQDRVHWQDVVNMETNLRDPYKAGNFLTNRATYCFLMGGCDPWTYLVYCIL